MILPHLRLYSRANIVENFSGMDSYEHCLDKSWFQNYPYNVKYCFNSRGFRDQEWPTSDQLSNAIWCLGDSFTVGLGNPVEHTWPYILQEATGIRCINISMDGASNDWIARHAVDILREIKPRTIVIQWSYFHRRENQNSEWSDEKRRQHTSSDLSETTDFKNFLRNYQLIETNKGNCQVLYSAIPGACTFDILQLQKFWDTFRGENWPLVPPITSDEYQNLPDHVLNELQNIQYLNFNSLIEYLNVVGEFHKIEQCNYILISYLDYSRDKHHYGHVTAKWFVDTILPLL